MRIGLFGGTFNPIHFGHLRSAEEIRESFQLEQIVFIPSAVPPHKEGSGIICPNHRAKMVETAIKENPGFSLSDIEIIRPGKSYSIETIDHFNRNYGSDSTLFFIMGMDAFAEIATWKDYKDLFSICNFIVTTRPGCTIFHPADMLPSGMAGEFSYVSEESRFVHASAFSLFIKEVTSLDISSSLIRKRIKENRSVRYFLPQAVIDYIYQNGLYRDF